MCVEGGAENNSKMSEGMNNVEQKLRGWGADYRASCCVSNKHVFFFFSFCLHTFFLSTNECKGEHIRNNQTYGKPVSIMHYKHSYNVF